MHRAPSRGRKSAPRLSDASSRLITATSDVAFVVDDEGVIADVTLGEGIEPKPGWKKLVGKPCLEVVATDTRTKIEPLLREAREGRTKRSRELNVEVEGLGEIPLRVSGVLLDDERHVVLLGRDLRPMSALQQRLVTTQQAVDREYGRLRQADTRYRVLFHVAGEGVLVVDATTRRVLEANPMAATILGESAQALQGQPVDDLVDGKSRPALHALVAAVEAGARPSDVQIAFVGQKDRPVTLSASLFRQSSTALVLFRFSHTASVAPASPRAARMLAVLDAMPDGIVVTGEDRRILATNDAFCELIQQGNENQLLGQPLDRWLGRPNVDLNIILANVREHGSVRAFSTIVRSDFGSSQEALVTAVSALDGKTPCFGFTVRPVSSRMGATTATAMPRSLDQLRELVGRVPLKELVRESADLIERLCIEAALDVSGNNRASAAQLLGLSRQGLYSKLRRHNLGDGDAENDVS